ncbi:MAG: TRAM domain-containing protein [bacterium]|nr:TRAM domain-containing protein [bacterium]MCX7917206.1 TRAM domain-containing protein [bacterium]MDW8163645.1 TRAM domain-containing protein [Candidatus Omnitrophota bacterium]
MGLWVIRGFFIILCVLAGFYCLPVKKILGILIGFVGSIIVIGIEILIGKIPWKKLILAVGGLIVGLITAILLANFFLLIPLENQRIEDLIRFSFYFVFSYLGIMGGIKGFEELGFILPILGGIREGEKLLIVDTSILIDGRVYELMKSGFIDYTLIIPKFIIKELQSLADASSDTKRQRGRRGLEVLNKLREDNDIKVRVYDIDYEDIEAVDTKIVKLASELNASILTNDFNLTKVAEVQNIKVLNLNTLTNLMRPRLMSGEEISLKIIKEGKEAGQGVGYLEDGTMVVVENASKYIGKVVDIIIDSAIQTPTGRIIFAKLK